MLSANRDWIDQRDRPAHEAVQEMLKAKAFIFHADEGRGCIPNFVKVHNEVKARHGGLDDSAVFTVVWDNWIAQSKYLSN